eukprot:SAG31_NODE_45280_length_259_cov_0.968750_1_plen_64_part_10
MKPASRRRCRDCISLNRVGATKTAYQLKRQLPLVALLDRLCLLKHFQTCFENKVDIEVLKSLGP